MPLPFYLLVIPCALPCPTDISLQGAFPPCPRPHPSTTFPQWPLPHPHTFGTTYLGWFTHLPPSLCWDSSRLQFYLSPCALPDFVPHTFTYYTTPTPHSWPPFLYLFLPVPVYFMHFGSFLPYLPVYLLIYAGFYGLGLRTGTPFVHHA